MYAEDLLQSVFPDAAACLDNLQGAREVPQHPLVQQALRDSLEEALDLPGLLRELQKLFSGELKLLAKDTPEPSVLCHEMLNSQVYTFLDDAPLEERRARAVYARRATEVRNADDLGALDPAAIQRVREEAWPVANTADELYDALMVAGYLLDEEITPRWRELLGELGHRTVEKDGRWCAMERKDDSAEELQASRMEVLGPIAEKENSILLKLEGQGRILRGRFTPGTSELEWCDRRLLARRIRPCPSSLRSIEFSFSAIGPRTSMRLAWSSSATSSLRSTACQRPSCLTARGPSSPSSSRHRGVISSSRRYPATISAS